MTPLNRIYTIKVQNEKFHIFLTDAEFDANKIDPLYMEQAYLPVILVYHMMLQNKITDKQRKAWPQQYQEGDVLITSPDDESAKSVSEMKAFYLSKMSDPSELIHAPWSEVLKTFYIMDRKEK